MTKLQIQRPDHTVVCNSPRPNIVRIAGDTGITGLGISLT